MYLYIFHCKKQLSLVNTYTFTATTNQDTNGWHGKGEGEVIAETLPGDMMLFKETGTFDNGRHTFQSNNTYRWKFDNEAYKIELEHFRFGLEKTVLLFEMYFMGDDTWESVEPHNVGGDEYHGKLVLAKDQITLTWNIRHGKLMNNVEYVYQLAGA